MPADNRYAFLVEWLDPQAQLVRQYLLFFYSIDGTVEMVCPPSAPGILRQSPSAACVRACAQARARACLPACVKARRCCRRCGPRPCRRAGCFFRERAALPAQPHCAGRGAAGWHGCGADGVPCCVQDDIKNRRKFLRRCEYPGEDGVLHVSRAAATRRQSERVVTLVRCKGADAQSRTERAGRECIALCWARCCSPGDAAGEADLRGALLQESRSRTCTWEQQSACTRASL